MKWYDNLNAEIVAPVAFGTISPGTPSTPVELRLINNLGSTGSDPLTNAHVLLLARDTGETSFVSGGKEYVDRFYLEIRIVGGYQSSPQTTTWFPMGSGRFFSIPEILNDEGIRFEIRVNPPADADPANPEVIFRAVQSPSEFLQVGISESGPDGIYHGLGDAGASEHILANDVLENGVPDQNVQTGLQVWVAAGDVYTKTDGLVNLAVSAAGNERYDLLSLKPDGTVETTTGTEVTAPVTNDDKPAIPAGNLPLAYVKVDDAGPISDSEIEQAYLRGYFGANGNGLNLEVGEGTAIVDNALVLRQTLSVLPLTPSTTNYVWMLRVGTFSVTTTATPPENRALLLFEATTDGSSVTALVDRRVLIGGELVEFLFHWDGTVTVNEERAHFNPSPRKARILPLGGVLASCLDIGDRTTGQLRFQVEVDDGGFANIFTTNERPPEMAFDASPPVDVGGVPEVWEIPPHSRIKAEPSTIPTTGGTTDPSDAVLIVRAVL